MNGEKTALNATAINDKIDTLSGWHRKTWNFLATIFIWLTFTAAMIALNCQRPYLMATIATAIPSLTLIIITSCVAASEKKQISIIEDRIYDKWTDVWMTSRNRQNWTHYVATTKNEQPVVIDEETFNQVEIGDFIYVIQYRIGNKTTIGISPEKYNISKDMLEQVVPYCPEDEDAYFRLLEEALSNPPIRRIRQIVPHSVTCPECKEEFIYKTGLCPYCGKYITPYRVAKPPKAKHGLRQNRKKA